MTHHSLPPQTMPLPSRPVLWAVLVGVSVVLPWINPFSSGPRANTIPLLVSGFCALALVVGYSLLQRGSATHKPCQPDAVLVAWLVAALLSSAMGLLQYFGQADTLSPWVNFTTAGQAFGNLRQRNQFASLTSIGLVALLYLAARLNARAGAPLAPQLAQRAAWHRTMVRSMVGGALVLLALANAASASRTGALQWLLVAALCALPHWRSARALAWSAVGVYALAIVALPMLLEQMTGLPQAGLITRLNESAGCESRRVLWANVLELIGQQPWLGWGWGELKFAHFIHPYGGERFCAILDNAHNLPLQLAVEWGLPLAVALCAALVWGVWRQQPWNETHPSRQAAWSVLAIIALHSLVEYPLWYGPFQMAVGLCVWLLWHHTAAAPQLPQTPQTAFAVVATGAVANGLRTVAALLTCLVLAYTAWDYTRVSQLYLPKAQRLAPYQEDTLAKVRGSRLFAHEVQFAELTTFTLTEDTAPRHYTLAGQLLHFSPEPRVVQTLLESAQLLGVDNPLLRQIHQRFEVAYPHDFAQWASHATP